MKIEVEVSEQEIKEAIERRIKHVICNELSGYLGCSTLKKKMQDIADEALDSAVRRIISDSGKIEQSVTSELEKIIRKRTIVALKQKESTR